MNKDDLAIISVIIICFLFLLVSLGWAIGYQATIAPIEYKKEIIEVYDIGMGDERDYILATNSSLWPNSPMQLQYYGEESLHSIVLVEVGDILEMSYRITHSLFDGGRERFHHESLKILINANGE